LHITVYVNETSCFISVPDNEAPRYYTRKNGSVQRLHMGTELIKYTGMWRDEIDGEKPCQAELHDAKVTEPTILQGSS
jgi:hypothetical protein